MAKINGFELKAIKKIIGMEGEGFTTNVHLDNKKIESCADYADGGPLNIQINWTAECEKRLTESFEKHPRVDTFELYKNHVKEEEYLKLKEENDLPVCKYNDYYDMMEYICNDLYALKMLEEDYKRSVKKGYSSIIYVSFISFYRTPCPVDMIYQTDGSEKSFQEVKTAEETKSKAVNLYCFNSLNDFIID